MVHGVQGWSALKKKKLFVRVVASKDPERSLQNPAKMANVATDCAWFVQYGKIRIKYDTAYYTNTP